MMRLLPLLIVACTLLLMVKAFALYNAYTGRNVAFPVQEILFIDDLNAEESPKDDSPTDEEKTEKKSEETKAEKPTEDKEDKKEANDPKKSVDAPQAEDGKEPTATPKPTSDSIDPPQDTRSFSKSELDVLESLASRRQQLQAWEQEIALKEKVLHSTETQLNAKILQMETLRKTLEELLAVYNEKEDIKIRSLVKIYENMKPQDAARIFEELDMTVLLQVIDKMKESRAAPILAKMDPTRAKEITMRLAEKKQIRPSDYQ